MNKRINKINIYLCLMVSYFTYDWNHNYVGLAILTHIYDFVSEKFMPFMITISHNKFNQFLQVLFGITNPELDILDTFEDVEYERRTVEVSLMVSVMEIHLIAFRASFTD